MGQFILMPTLLAFAQFALGHVAGDQRVVTLATAGAMGDQHQRYRKRRRSLPWDQTCLGVPNAGLLGALPTFTLQLLR
ncbi:hypothetical protein D3C77_424550 [compost metagenome]